MRQQQYMYADTERISQAHRSQNQMLTRYLGSSQIQSPAQANITAACPATVTDKQVGNIQANKAILVSR